MPDHDMRLEHLQQWLAPQLAKLYAQNQWGPVPEITLTAASSDASFRRYFRWQDPTRSFIVMDAPPPQENCGPFVDIAERLKVAALHVPVVLAQDLANGFLLLTDLGRQTYLDVLTDDNADALFADAIDALLVQQSSVATHALAEYDQALLMRDLNLFSEWYVERELGLNLSAEQAHLWQASCKALLDSALAQPKVFVHRDFMPRNLMYSTPNPGVLDFQDAVLGPITYDVTCLFKDAFISWDLARVDRWLKQYWEKARAQGLPVAEDFADFLRASDLMGVQRHLKVLGIFARICHRDGKPKYLGDAPRFIAYIQQVLARRPELAPLGELFNQLGLIKDHHQ